VATIVRLYFPSARATNNVTTAVTAATIATPINAATLPPNARARGCAAIGNKSMKDAHHDRSVVTRTAPRGEP